MENQEPNPSLPMVDKKIAGATVATPKRRRRRGPDPIWIIRPGPKATAVRAVLEAMDVEIQEIR